MPNILIETLSQIHLVSLIIGLSILIMGLITLKFPPKKINFIYGYRTGQSMKSQSNWELAQKYSAGEMIKGGVLITAFAFTGIIYNTSILVETIAGTALMLVVIVLLIVRTERMLRKSN